MELQIGEISGEISVDDLRLIIRDNIRLWNWGVRVSAHCGGRIHFLRSARRIEPRPIF